MKKWVFILLLFLEVLVLPNIFLFTPKPNEWNFYNYESIIGFPVVIDAIEFIHPSIDLKVLRNVKEKRQSRPLYMVIGYYLGNAMEWVLKSSNPSFLQSIKQNCRSEIKKDLTRLGDPLDKVIAHYLGFVIFNFVILFVSAILFADLVSIANIPRTIALLAFSIFMVNDIMKTFLWTVHQQMFTIFTPIVMIWWLSKFCTNPKNTNWIFYLITSTCTGILLLVYGNLILLLPTILYGYLIVQNWNIRTIHTIMVLAGIVLLFALPSIYWIWFVTQKAGYYYNYEISEFRQLVWPIDYVKNLGILKAGFICMVYTKNFLSTFLYPDIIPFILILVILFGTKIIVIQKIDFESIIKYPNIPMISLLVFLTGFCFFCMLGYYRPRITFLLVVPIVIFISIGIKNIWQKKAPRLLTCAFVVIWISKHYFVSGNYM